MRRDPQGTEDVQPVHVSITISALGVRARADGHSGLAAWRIIRRQQPLLAWAALGYVALLVVGVLSLLVVIQ
ncbi:hypothetical protein [Streptomyces tricolor]|uniref:hypothetical protein n=1 Tax=Streptomyces tricolor TaxID=68277 RepID=UPI0036E14C33